jgi:4-hydroxythreonine-4-phosphate dehydrogenase
MKPIVITMGCPSGIGPEVALAALAKRPRGLVLAGDLATLRARAPLVGVSPERLVQVRDLGEEPGLARSAMAVLQATAPLAKHDRQPGKPSTRTGAAQLEFIDCALALVLSGEASAMTTGPVNKEVIAASGLARARRFRGHTEYLEERAGAPPVTMAFWSAKLTVALVTTHLPLSAVSGAINVEGVRRATVHVTELMLRLGVVAPRIAVAALNPHAGEGGLLGDEEERLVGPGIALARAQFKRNTNVSILGPVPAETAFRVAASGGFDAVVAMYHDQATIPMKLVGFGDAVNVTLGLPIVRTSVDHGTAYDRAGKGTADATGMVGAIALAQRLVAALIGSASPTRKSARTRR